METLRQLAPRQRAVVVLRHFLQYDVAATAEALGERGGRTFYVYPGGGPLQVGVPQPTCGWLILQDAPRLHWTTQQPVDYLDGVVVGADALPDPD